VPIPPPVPTVPFDQVDVAMNMARMRINDCPLSLAGNLLADTQPYAQQTYNLAWRSFQRDLAEFGDPAQTNEFWSPSLPVVTSTDSFLLVYLGQADYFDGQNYWVPPDVNLLPQDLICPLQVKERQGGTTQGFIEMLPCDNGLPMGPKTAYLRFWEWRSAGPGNGNAIFMPGATVTRDLYVRYASFLPDAVTTGTVQWYQQNIPMLRCADILAFYIAAEFSYSRGSEQAKAVANSFWADGKEAMRQYVNSTTMKLRQRINHRRHSYSAGKHRGWAWW
jgi:hypothetical protein